MFKDISPDILFIKEQANHYFKKMDKQMLNELD